MAHTKATGSTQNTRDSQPKYLGIKLFDGEKAMPGAIIVRQRGTQIWPGRNVSLGKDHTIFSLKAGTVKFSQKRHMRFDGKNKKVKVVSVISS